MDDPCCSWKRCSESSTECSYVFLCDPFGLSSPPPSVLLVCCFCIRNSLNNLKKSTYPTIIIRRLSFVHNFVGRWSFFIGGAVWIFIHIHQILYRYFVDTVVPYITAFQPPTITTLRFRSPPPIINNLSTTTFSAVAKRLQRTRVDRYISNEQPANC